jgi:DNA-binding transcriptional ArsR family regulator
MDRLKRRAADGPAGQFGMEKALWYLLAGTRGGENRARIIRTLEERPRNANQLAEALDVDYNTVRHHLDVLLDHDVVERGGDDYGALYFLTDRFEDHRDVFDRITEEMD